jgi:predicted CopG family antitoxin
MHTVSEGMGGRHVATHQLQIRTEAYTALQRCREELETERKREMSYADVILYLAARKPDTIDKISEGFGELEKIVPMFQPVLEMMRVITIQLIKLKSENELEKHISHISNLLENEAKNLSRLSPCRKMEGV